MTEKSNPYLEIFEDPEHAVQYPNSPAKFMPGFHDVHRMAGVLIREYAPPDAHVLVHGAGGGLELEAFANENPQWTFLGVDPAKPMLDEARNRIGILNGRVTLHQGYAEDAPVGPYDAATSFLTLHFLKAKERQEAVSEIVRRLKPGSIFVTAHCSFPQNSEHKGAWLARHREFSIASGMDAEVAENRRKAIADNIEVLDPKSTRKSCVTQAYQTSACSTQHSLGEAGLDVFCKSAHAQTGC